MRELGVLTVLLALAGGAAYLVTRWSRIEPSETPAQAANIPRPKRVRKAPKKNSLQEAVPAPELPPPPVQPPVPAPTPFPTSDDIPIGTDRTTLLRAFGSPNLKTWALHQGQPIEIWEYSSSDRTRATQVRLRENKVVFVHTGSN
jgi:hypothetical protein